ncbi:hypothetical protein, partial [Pseudomonas sp. MIL9]|uniref:hypothetical protein n=1 Tax=Pseudomonas sp. MIL9 TaxID=2807620 RepID=UPI00194E4C88
MIYLFATRQKVARLRSGVHLARSFDWSDAIAGKPAPTVICGVIQISDTPKNLWELACQRLGSTRSQHSTALTAKPPR